MYPTEPARELSQYFVSDPELIPKIKTALRKVNGGPQDPSLNPLTGKPPVWRIPTRPHIGIFLHLAGDSCQVLRLGIH